MEVHAHSHPPSGGTRKKWTHYLWEFIMLFLAVFCGFLAELQLEHKIEHQREKQYAQSLYDDFKVDTAVIQRTLDEKVWIMEKYDSALHILESKDLEQNNEFLYLTERYLSNNDVFTSQDVTYQQLRNSGSFRYFKNIDLYKMIADYFNLYNRYQSIDGSFGGFDKKDKLKDFESNMFNPADLISMDNRKATSYYDLSLPANRKLEKMNQDEKGLKEFYLLIANESNRTNAAKLFLAWLKQKAALILTALKKEYRLTDKTP